MERDLRKDLVNVLGRGSLTIAVLGSITGVISCAETPTQKPTNSPVPAETPKGTSIQTPTERLAELTKTPLPTFTPELIPTPPPNESLRVEDYSVHGVVEPEYITNPENVMDSLKVLDPIPDGTSPLASVPK